MEKAYSLLQIVAVALGILTPCILLAGYSYHLGYISAFKLDPSLLNRGLTDVVAESWYMGANLLIALLSTWKYIVATGVVLGLLGLAALYAGVKLKARNINIRFKAITQDNQGHSVCGLTLWHWLCWWQMLSELGKWIWLALVALALVSTVMVMPFQRGHEGAKLEITQLQKSGCDDTAKGSALSGCVYLVDISSQASTPIAKGVLVAATKEHVAIFSGDKLEVWPWLDSYKLQKPYRAKAK